MGPTTEDIKHVTEALVRQFHPEKVILFGSRAYGTPRHDSDADLLVVLPFDCSPYRMTAEMLMAIHPRHGFDIMPRTPGDVASRYAGGDPVIREAIDRGIVMYEAAA